MTHYKYAVTKSGKTWSVVNRNSRTPISGPYNSQDDAETAAEKRARMRASQGIPVDVYIEDESGAERLRHRYEPTDDSDDLP